MPCLIDYENPRNAGSGNGCPEYCVTWPLVFDANKTVVLESNWPELTTTVGEVLLYGGTAYILVFTALYLHLLAKNCPRLVRRPNFLIILAGLSTIVLLITLEAREMVGRENFSCLLFIIGQFYSLSCSLGPYTVQTVVLWYRYKYKQLQLKQWQNKTHEEPASRKLLESYKKRSTTLFGVKMQLGYFLISMAAVIALILPRPDKYRFECTGCDDDIYEIVVITFVITSINLPCLYYIYQLQNELDPLHRICELRTCTIIHVFFMVPFLLLHIFDPGQIQITGQWEWGHAVSLAVLAMFTVSVPYQVYLSYTTAVPASNEEREKEFMHFMESDQARPFFYSYLCTEFANENLMFYQDVYKFKSLYKELPLDLRNAQAKAIIRDFVDTGSSFEINIGQHQRKEVKKSVEEDVIKENVFDDPFKEVNGFLREAFPRFLESEIYQTYFRTYFNHDDSAENTITPASMYSSCCFSRGRAKKDAMVNASVADMH